MKSVVISATIILALLIAMVMGFHHWVIGILFIAALISLAYGLYSIGKTKIDKEIIND